MLSNWRELNVQQASLSSGNRFTLVEAFFLEVNLEVSNFYQLSTPLPRFLRACVNISNLRCQSCLLINWLLINRKGIYNILTAVSFVVRDAKCFCFIYRHVAIIVPQRNESGFLFCFIIYSRYFVPSRLSYKQLPKNTCQPYKICYRKAYVTTTGFKSLI